MPDVTPDDDTGFCSCGRRRHEPESCDPDDDNDGVEVWRHRFDDDEFWMEWEDENRGNDRTPYRAFKTLRAEQLLAIEKAARYVSLVYLDRDGNVCGLDKLADALRPAAPGTPE